MNAEQAHRSWDLLVSSWRYPTWSAAQKDVWLRAMTDPLSQVSESEFAQANEAFIRQGGSIQASRPGFCPSAPEFMAMVRRLRSDARAHAKPVSSVQSEGVPAYRSEQFRAAKASVPALKRRAK